MKAQPGSAQAVMVPKGRGLPDFGETVIHLERVVTLEVALYLGALLLGFVLRFLLLDQRPLSVEESALASEAYRVSVGHPPDSLHQGAFSGFGTALALLLFAGGDGAARALPALAGSLLVGVPYLLRSSLGRPAALIAAYGMAISPVMLFASREVGGGMVAATLALLLWAAVEPGWKKLTRGRAFGAAFLLAALFASGSVGSALLFSLGVAALLAHPQPQSSLAELRRILTSTMGRQAGLLFVASLLVVGSNFGSNPSGLQWAIVDGWAGWVRSFSLSTSRGTVALLMLLYEFPVVVLGMVQLVRTVVRRDRVDSFLSLWAMVLLLLSLTQTGDMTSRVLLPLLPLYLLAARLVGDSLARAKGINLGWRWLVCSVAVAIPIAVGMVMLSRLSAPGMDTPSVYFLAEACVIGAAAILIGFLLDGRTRLSLAWWTLAVLGVGFMVHNGAFLNYRAESVAREPLVGTQISTVLRDAASYEGYISQYFRTPVTVDPQLREPLSWYLRSATDVTFSGEPGQGIGLSLLRDGTAPIDPGSDRRPGLYAPTIGGSGLSWQEVWRWTMSRDGLVRPNQRDIIVRAPAGNW